MTIYRGDGSVQQALLKDADAVLGIYSSTMMEAPLFDCIPIIFNPTEIRLSIAKLLSVRLE